MLALINIRNYLNKKNRFDDESHKKNELAAEVQEKDQIIHALSLISKNHKKWASLKDDDDA